MGGPWRDRGFDPTAWRAPVAARTSARIEAVTLDDWDPLAAAVIGYVAAALTSVGVLLVLLRNGW